MFFLVNEAIKLDECGVVIANEDGDDEIEYC